jgi:uncharacterized protein (DUF2147 family)
VKFSAKITILFPISKTNAFLFYLPQKSLLVSFSNNLLFSPPNFNTFIMKKVFYTLFFVFCGFFLFGQKADAIVGTYLNADGKSKIEFFKSGDTYSGKIVWLQTPNDEKGNPKKDVKNSDKSLRDRPLMGLVNITGLKYDGDGKYVDGKVYRPAEGDELKLRVKINADGSIDVTGTKYGINITKTWKKL